MAIPKIKVPKIQLKLAVVLWGIFLAVILFELYFLYTVFVNQLVKTETSAPTAPTTRGVNFALYEEAMKWIEAREDFTLPPYTFEKATSSGRANPMAQY